MSGSRSPFLRGLSRLRRLARNPLRVVRAWCPAAGLTGGGPFRWLQLRRLPQSGSPFPKRIGARNSIQNGGRPAISDASAEPPSEPLSADAAASAAEKPSGKQAARRVPRRARRCCVRIDRRRRQEREAEHKADAIGNGASSRTERAGPGLKAEAATAPLGCCRADGGRASAAAAPPSTGAEPAPGPSERPGKSGAPAPAPAEVVSPDPLVRWRILARGSARALDKRWQDVGGRSRSPASQSDGCPRSQRDQRHRHRRRRPPVPHRTTRARPGIPFSRQPGSRR